MAEKKAKARNLSELFWHLEQEGYVTFYIESSTIMVYSKECEDGPAKLAFTYPGFSAFVREVEEDIQEKIDGETVKKSTDSPPPIGEVASKECDMVVGSIGFGRS